jgi:hypothetical protein
MKDRIKCCLSLLGKQLTLIISTLMTLNRLATALGKRLVVQLEDR